MLDGNDLAVHPARATDAPGQRMHAADTRRRASSRASSHAHRLRPVVDGRQQQRMEGQHQVEHRHGPVQEAPGPVGKALPQGQHQHRQHGVDGPFAHVLGELAQHFQQAGVLLLRQASFAADHGLQDVVRHLDQPVHGGEADGEDARPLVRAIDAIQAAQRPFEPGRPGGQHHRQRHQGDRQQAAQVQAFLADDPGRRCRRTAPPATRTSQPQARVTMARRLASMVFMAWTPRSDYLPPAALAASPSAAGRHGSAARCSRRNCAGPACTPSCRSRRGWTRAVADRGSRRSADRDTA